MCTKICLNVDKSNFEAYIIQVGLENNDEMQLYVYEFLYIIYYKTQIKISR